MKSSLHDKLKRKGIIEHAIALFNKDISENQMIWFMYGDKNALNMKFIKSERKNLQMTGKVLSGILSFVTNVRVYYFIIKDDIYLSKTKPPLYNKDNVDYVIGIFLSFPKCCVKKYREEGGSSYNSAKGYLEQCKAERLKDCFEIYLGHNTANCSEYGFIPCHPKCKNALNIINKIKSIKKEVENDR